LSAFAHYEDEVRTLVTKRDAAPLPGGGVVAFYGSSSIRLWDSLAEDFFDVPVVNLGFGGSTLAACAHYFERVVVPARPRALVCYAGENDIGDGQLPDAVVNSFRSLHAQVANQLGDTPFAYLSIKPSPNRWQHVGRIREVNRRIAEEIAAREHSHFLDVFTPMLRDDGTPRRELWTEDGIHMNSLGYHVWWQVIASQRRRIGF
jgi:lysophospholipase L1-like esterase